MLGVPTRSVGSIRGFEIHLGGRQRSKHILRTAIGRFHPIEVLTEMDGNCGWLFEQHSRIDEFVVRFLDLGLPQQDTGKQDHLTCKNNSA